MAMKTKVNHSNEGQRIGDFKEAPITTKISEDSAVTQSKLVGGSKVSGKRQLTNSGFGTQFPNSPAKQTAPGAEYAVVTVPFKRAKELLILNLLMNERSTSLEDINPTNEEVEEFMATMTIEKLNQIYSFEGNGFVSPELGPVKFTISPL